jgi:hypothetical protein
MKVFHDRDVGLVEFALPEKKRFPIRRKCQTTIERKRPVESEDGCGLAIRKIEEFNPAVRRKLSIQEVDSVASNVPDSPGIYVNRQEGFLPTL